MTDISLVKEGFSTLLDFTDEEIAGYDSLISFAVSTICPMINEGVDENDARIVYLCVLKAYYHIELLRHDDVSTFKAGEVSVSVDTSALANAKMLLDEALTECSSLIKSKDFDFRVV